MIGQISEMNQQCQHVIFAFEALKIVLEAVRVHFDFFSGNQAGNQLLQPFEIHVDIGKQGFRRRCPLPV